MKQDDLDNRFTFHPVRGNEAAVYATVRRLALDLARSLDELVPDGRELSLAITHLEEAVFWANAGIARGPFIHTEPDTFGGPARIVKER